MAEPAVRAFWRDVNELRRERGLSYKQLERRVRIPDSTLQYWMTRSRRLVPWLEVRKVILALGEPDQTWFHRWKHADRQAAGWSRP
jgi:transcriptional regulator with XRE-family HTH domain